MGFDNECIINIQSLKGEYFCPVCRLLVYPNEALQAQCSHLYCKPCLPYVARTTQACPYDGYLVTEADAKPLLESNKVLADTIGKIAVNCLFHRSGCTWQGQLTDCKSHCAGCQFGDSSVMCNRCGVQIVHRQVEEHAQNCPGVQAQAPQSDSGQVTSGTASSAPANQNQAIVPASTPASQAQIASMAVQKPAQQVNPATQPQAAQLAMPNTEQWYQQQQQYQQYYQQQYPGYDPYQQQQQQQFQQYFPYQQQAVQQPAQMYQQQAQGQQQVPLSQPPQQLAQAPSTAQPQSHPPQTTPNIQQQVQPAVQPQTLQNQVAYSVAQSQPQAYSQVQPYAHTQAGPTQALPQQGMQMPPYQQTRPQMQQPPPSQVQAQPYTQPQAQAQQYSHPQSHMPAQTQTHPHTMTHPIQPMNHAGSLQAQNVQAHAVTGYQSYQQAQAPPLQQTQVGAPQSLQMNGLHQQPSNHSQFQGQYPQQPTQVRPIMPNQQPTMVHPQVQNAGASVAQVPVYPHSKHPGYPQGQQHSGMPPVQHSSVQPQGFPGHGPYVQQHPAMQAPAHLQPLSQSYQQNSTQASIQSNVRPMTSHGGGQQPYSQAPGHTNAAHLLPNQPRSSQPLVNQSYPSLPVHGQVADAQIMGRGKQETNNVEHSSGNVAGVRNAELSNTSILEPKPIVGSDAKPRAFENGTPQNGNMKIKEGIMDNATEQPSASKSADVGKEDTKENEQRPDKGFSTSALPPAPISKQVPVSHAVQSSDLGRNQLGGPPGQLGATLGLAAVAPYGRGPGSVGLLQGHFNQGKFHGGPPFVSPPPPGTRGGMIGGVRPDFPEGSFNNTHPPNSREGPGGFFDGRHPELRPHGSMEQRPYGQTPSLHRLQDERRSMLPEEHVKHFPTDHSFGRNDYDRDLQKFPRPSHLEGGTPVKFGSRFPPPHDQGDRHKPGGYRDVSLGRLGYPDFPRPVHGFGHHGSPGRDFRAGPTPGFGSFPHDIDRNESHSYPLGKAFQEGRFPGPPGHLHRGEFDGPINMHGSKHSRAGDAIGQDMRPMHSRRGDFGPGSFGGHLEMGEPPFPGSFRPPRPFAEPFGRDIPGYPHHGEPGFKGMRYAHDEGFYRGVEPFDNPRKRNPGSIMCRICNVDCETVEGLDLHSQTREHQKQAMDMVISIKQQYSKKQKVSNQRSMLEDGRKNRTANFEGHGKKH